MVHRLLDVAARNKWQTLLSLVVGFMVASPALASIKSYGIFGDRNVDIAARLNQDMGGAGAGPIGSNGSTVVWDINVASGSFTLSIGSGGSFNIASNGTILGDIVVNGNAEFASDAKIFGNIDVGGNAAFASDSAVVGNIRVGGDVNFAARGDVQGNVDAGGKGTFASNNKISGDLTLGGNLVNPGNVTVGGTTSANGSPNAPTPPSAYTPVAVPGASVFPVNTSALPDIAIPAAGESLNPGAYGDITAAADRVLKLLTPGDYFFNSIDAGARFDLWVDLAAGMYNIFVTGDVKFAADLQIFDKLGNLLNPLTQGALGKNLFLETHGNFDAAARADWFGTIFAPDGNITFASDADIAGALWAGNENGNASGGIVKLASDANFSYYEANQLPSQFPQPPPPGGSVEGGVPEPMALVVWSLLIGSAGLAAARRRDRADDTV